MGRAEFYNPATGKREPIKAGSIVNSSGLEYTPDQIKGIDNKINNLSTDVNDHKADYIHHAGYGAASGTNAKTITLNPAPITYKEGMTIAFKNATQNTGAVTINVNNLGAKPVLKSNGNALTSGNLKANSVYTVRYNGSNFILQGEGGEYGTAQTQDVLSGKTIGTEDGIITGTMPNRGGISKALTTQGGQYTIPEGYHNGSGIIKAQFANLVAENIKKGVNVGGVVGTFNGKRIQAGFVTNDNSISSYEKFVLTIRNLDFTPKSVITFCYWYKYQSAIGFSFYSPSGHIFDTTIDIALMSGYSATTSGFSSYTNGFNISAYKLSNNNENITDVYWIAIE